MKIGYLGLGKMGAPMARNLLAAGHDLVVWNRSRGRVTPLVKLGADAARTPRDVARKADIVLYCVAGEAAIEDVVFGKDGLLAGSRPQQIAIDLSTTHPDISRRQAAAWEGQGAHFLDAPVFGSVEEAESGNLWIVVGGERSVFERSRPIFTPVSQSVHYIGPGGAGATMSLIGSLVVGFQLQALSEALVLASRAGLEPSLVLDILDLPDFRSPIFKGLGGGIPDRDFGAKFALKHLKKDLDYVIRLAASLVLPLPATSLIREHVTRAVELGFGDQNASALIKVLEAAAGLKVATGTRKERKIA